ncbi:MAG: ribosomal protein S18-alanine N-acetyltransferase [Burkholderiaceae bacterium]
MSAQPIATIHDPASVALAPMRLADIADVAAIERSIYAAPWTEGNFVDSLTAGYCAWVLRPSHPSGDPVKQHAQAIIGYFVLMAAIDEAHLLNVSVAIPWQRCGHGLYLLRKATALALEYHASSVILEVRPSNSRALAVYRCFGFRDHGLRRRYYPASASDQQSREDAIVMRLQL